jgi:hypothetical protein
MPSVIVEPAAAGVELELDDELFVVLLDELEPQALTVTAASTHNSAQHRRVVSIYLSLRPGFKRQHIGVRGAPYLTIQSVQTLCQPRKGEKP